MIPIDYPIWNFWDDPNCLSYCPIPYNSRAGWWTFALSGWLFLQSSYSLPWCACNPEWSSSMQSRNILVDLNDECVLDIGLHRNSRNTTLFSHSSRFSCALKNIISPQRTGETVWIKGSLFHGLVGFRSRRWTPHIILYHPFSSLPASQPSKAEEMYQMITLGGDAELELVACKKNKIEFCIGLYGSRWN